MPDDKNKKKNTEGSYEPSEFEIREEFRELFEEVEQEKAKEPQPEGLAQFDSIHLDTQQHTQQIAPTELPSVEASVNTYAHTKEKENEELNETIRLYEAQFQQVKTELEELKNKNRALLEKVSEQRTIEELLRKEKKEIESKLQKEAWELKNFYEERLQSAEKLDVNLSDFHRQRDDWKKKVKEELNKIKLKEKEIENKYELLKSDSQALLDSKDKQILDLKKKIDAFELEQENLEERLRKSQSVQQIMVSKKTRLLETIRLVTQLLETLEDPQDPAEFTGSKPPDGSKG